jgi:biopolymer transport protein ExbD
MRFRVSRTIGDEKIELQMTPMIDIVFQLLVFFIMSFKIVAQEGDFDIKMPIPSRAEGLPDQSSLPMLLRLRAADDGRLAGLSLNGQPFNTFSEVHNYIIGIVGSDEPELRENAEVELDCDYDLNYENVIEAITAVSGYIDSTTGKVVKLVEKIKFAPPKNPPGDGP